MNEALEVSLLSTVVEKFKENVCSHFSERENLLGLILKEVKNHSLEFSGVYFRGEQIVDVVMYELACDFALSLNEKNDRMSKLHFYQQFLSIHMANIWVRVREKLEANKGGELAQEAGMALLGLAMGKHRRLTTMQFPFEFEYPKFENFFEYLIEFAKYRLSITKPTIPSRRLLSGRIADVVGFLAHCDSKKRGFLDDVSLSGSQVQSESEFESDDELDNDRQGDISKSTQRKSSKRAKFMTRTSHDQPPKCDNKSMVDSYESLLDILKSAKLSNGSVDMSQDDWVVFHNSWLVTRAIFDSIVRYVPTS